MARRVPDCLFQYGYFNCYIQSADFVAAQHLAIFCSSMNVPRTTNIMYFFICIRWYNSQWKLDDTTCDYAQKYICAE